MTTRSPGANPLAPGAGLGHLTRAFGPEHDRHLRRREPALAHEHVLSPRDELVNIPYTYTYTYTYTCAVG